jgi:N-glycosylase/DNA lyase
VPRREYFYELVYCLLTPQSSAVRAGRAVEDLRRADVAGIKNSPVDILAKPEQYIRFHRTKARWIDEARANFASIDRELSNGSTSEELREWLVKNVRGLGWKEASHFLRNIGHRNLAILDRHILRNLRAHAVLRSLPRSMTRKQYLRIEQKFVAFASAVGISMDELDLYFWSKETGEILK